MKLLAVALSLLMVQATHGLTAEQTAEVPLHRLNLSLSNYRALAAANLMSLGRIQAFVSRPNGFNALRRLKNAEPSIIEEVKRVIEYYRQRQDPVQLELDLNDPTEIALEHTSLGPGGTETLQRAKIRTLKALLELRRNLGADHFRKFLQRWAPGRVHLTRKIERFVDGHLPRAQTIADVNDPIQSTSLSTRSINVLMSLGVVSVTQLLEKRRSMRDRDFLLWVDGAPLSGAFVTSEITSFADQRKDLDCGQYLFEFIK